ELPTSSPEGAQASIDHTLHTRRPLSATTRWRMTSAAPVAFEPVLRGTLRDIALRLPEGYNPRTVALAQAWRAQAGNGNDAVIVDRALGWVRAEFGYTLTTPLPGRHAVDEFLFDYKEGFCEHFSSA